MAIDCHFVILFSVLSPAESDVCWVSGVCVCGKQGSYPGLSGLAKEELHLNSMMLTSGSERMSFTDVSYSLFSLSVTKIRMTCFIYEV